MQISYFDKECDVNFYYSFTIFLQQKTIEYKEDKKKKSRLLEQRKIVIHSFIINLLSNYYLPEVTDNMLIFLILKKIP